MSTSKNAENLTVGGISFSPDEIAFLQEGGSLSGNASEGSTVFNATRAVDISEPAGHNLRPAISGNDSHDNRGARISRPSKNLAAKLDDTKHRQELAKADRKRAEELSVLEPTALRRDLEYLRREVKRLTKEVKELKANEAS